MADVVGNEVSMGGGPANLRLLLNLLLLLPASSKHQDRSSRRVYGMVVVRRSTTTEVVRHGHGLRPKTPSCYWLRCCWRVDARCWAEAGLSEMGMGDTG